jgi:calcineurin-like phosphoesterase family protein
MHKNVIRFDNRPFGTIDEMDEVLVNNWNSVDEIIERSKTNAK